MDFGKIEKKWQKIWKEKGIYKTKEIKNKPEYYILDMFPYPSGEGLHVGHPRGYIATDVIARYKTMKGFNVLHPMGWDAFGLPAENYALKHKIHPKIAVEKNVKRFKNQLSQFGFTYDWNKEINTADPEYYKWTQWIFLKLFENGLVYSSDEPIIWCPICKTGLAFEDLENGRCERCESEIEKKPLRQWVLKMTDYAEKLLNGLKNLDWPESIKEQQRNWIGKSEGTKIKFPISNLKSKSSKETFNFRPYLAPLVLSGEKYITYRLKPKNVKVGDVCEFFNWETNKKFALARIIKIEKKKIKNVSEKEEGHEKFKNRKEFYKTYETYYGFKVTDDTDVWFYYFELVPEYIEVFTTRVDTIFGCTYLVMAPEHKLVSSIKYQVSNWREVGNYIEQAKKKSDLQRTDLVKEKTGAELKGIKAINPFNNEEIPVFIADYVLPHYGAGAVMAVPAHDERDFEFAKKYNLPVRKVIASKESQQIQTSNLKSQNDNSKFKNEINKAFTEDGILINSRDYSGITSEEAREKMSQWLEKNKFGAKKINYKMRDWIFARQRYWGEPFPLVFCEHCAKKIKSKKFKKGEFTKGELLNPGWIQILEENLPVKLPNVKYYEPTGTGESPLANITKWVNIKCPKCKNSAKRETNTMPQWAGSCWYYIGYLIKKGKKYDWNKKIIDKWLPVDLYVGGVEHATRHLLYARFWHKFLYDIKEISAPEPFQKLMNQGLILAEDGRKMSKRWNNVVNPDDMINIFGADALRLYEMFIGPFNQNIAWNIDGIKGMKRFLERIWKFYNSRYPKNPNKNKKNSDRFVDSDAFVDLDRVLNQTIKKVTEDIENFRFNTAISALMILFNELEKQPSLKIENWKLIIKLLTPFAPHLAEELWQQSGNKKLIYFEQWPKYDSKLIEKEKFELIIQINGKIKDKISMIAGISKEEAEKSAFGREKIKNLLSGQKIKNIIFVPNKLINIVV